MLASARSAKDADGIRESLEALRFGCATRQPPPRVIALAEPKLAERIRTAVRPFPFDAFVDAALVIGSLRSLRQRADPEATLRDQLLEDAARSLAESAASDALVVDVSEAMTSCALARADGTVEVVHAMGIGLGVAADRVVARAGIDRVRRWLEKRNFSNGVRSSYGAYRLNDSLILLHQAWRGGGCSAAGTHTAGQYTLPRHKDFRAYYIQSQCAARCLGWESSTNKF